MAEGVMRAMTCLFHLLVPGGPCLPSLWRLSICGAERPRNELLQVMCTSHAASHWVLLCQSGESSVSVSTVIRVSTLIRVWSVLSYQHHGNDCCSLVLGCWYVW